YPPKPPVGPLHNTVQIKGEREAYALYVPEKYDPSASYPLIICLHGAGFTGDTYLERWQSRLGEKSILACPTIENGAWWSPEAETLVLSVIDSVQSKYHIDPNRIFLTGMSNGGIGAYLIGMFHADHFAALSPMAAGIPDEIFPFLRNLTSTGIYIIHGSKDEVMPVTLSRKVSDYLKSEGIRYTYKEHALEHPMAGGHFFPKEELPSLVTWFEQQQRNPYPARVVSVRDQVHLDPFYWTEVNETAGEVANVQDSIFDKKEVDRVKKGEFATLIAEVHQNRVEVKTDRVKKYTLYFNPRLVDFSKPVMIFTNGQKSFEGKLSEKPELLLKEAQRRKDPGALYRASVTIDLPQPKVP
ncbi:MAG TPA: alpha/beta hydrolase-fold protein, partial [Candidatus Manganitrophaceae bacterium]|nr:alpha/beta hydrolase-fold protein [Candidatus Manganitrophaceae bacterium]